MHFCADELYAILMMLPFLGVVINWLRSKLWRKKCDHCGEEPRHDDDTLL